ncbi:DUF4296 domain-containing protein [Lacinutrix sp. Bg11-31]|uniref:DUF4296 domain-containing protein n=1 Tax=Lacinutrix sp. Bg11-31 TaxID=2057808 RepID=UPI000C300884|nr:DUF4296 domain-containing protein [Lacinutrix sp. Bg11-31]AUC82615.1 DUF4296 domain-containing protein [Lacinutrix sp. Bg11-31]
MKLKHLSFLLLFLTLSSCYNVVKPNKPNNLISEDNMVNVLVDMAIMSSAKGVNKSRLEKNGIVPDEYIYKKNSIDSLTFAESNAYYAFDIKKYDVIYKRVKDSLTVIRDKYKAIDTKEKEEKKIKDSIKKANVNIDKGINTNPKSKKK